MPSTQGSAAAADFEAIYEATNAGLLAFARRRSATREDAEDVVAETFIVLWRRVVTSPTPVDETTVAWLYTVARNVLSNQHRAIRRRGKLVERVWALPGCTSASYAATMLAADASDSALVLAALDRLGPSQREVIGLLLDGNTAQAIAGELCCTPNAAAVRVHRARAALRSLLAVHTPRAD
jgi:RNA polymerase sigma-70 factor (ECF subfamily)